MKKYCLDNFTTASDYANFIKYMLSKSDYFSLIDFRYKKNEPLKNKSKRIFELLKNNKIGAQYATKWPGTEIADKDHFYKIVFYKSNIEAHKALTIVDNIFEWYYPNAPMDLCFYRQGYCWYESIAHETEAYLYVDDVTEITEIEKLNLNIWWSGETNDDLFQLNEFKFFDV